MSLLKQKKENDRVAAEAAAKAKEEAFLRDLAVHPVVKMGCGRDVRDAYLCGIVVAAIANDDKIDAEERSVLDRVANSMELRTSDVVEVITEVNQLSVDEKLQLLGESVGALKDQSDLVKFFYAQFAELWFTGEHDLGELEEIAGMLVAWSGVEFTEKRLKDIKAVVSNGSTLNAALDDLATWLGDDMLKRFALGRYGDVSPRIEQSRKDKRDAAEASKQKQAEEEQRREADKVSGFFETVAGIVEEMRIVNESRVNNMILKSFRSRLTAKGLETVDTVKAYKAIYDAFVSKADKAARKQKRASAESIIAGALNAIVKGEASSELEKSFYQVSWAVIALCILKKDVDSADLSQFNGLLQDAHSHGMKRVAFRSVTYDPNYFWKTYLHERVAKILGLGSINEGDVVVEAPKKNIGRGGGEGDRRKRIFENASVKRLFSEWQRLCGAYCKEIPELTYQVQDAGRRCVHGIALPRNYLKDVALKFLSGSVSPSFQGRGETEWVKDRGAVLGILLLHYIGSSDFNPSGEEVEDLRQIYQLAQRQSIQDRLVAHIHKYLEIE